MFGVTVDAANFVGRVLAFSKAFPKETSQALNKSAFEVRKGWSDEIVKIFDRPAPLTVRAPLYKKSSPQVLVAEVYIRNEVSKGTPPSAYLIHHVRGGPRNQKASERLLNRNLGMGKYWVPGPGAPLNSYGNVSQGWLNKVLSSVQANNDPQQHTIGRKQGRRGRGRKRIFFRVPAGADTKLNRSIIYERKSDRSIIPVIITTNKVPQYRKRFDAFGLAQRIFYDRFKVNINGAVSRAWGRS